MSRLDLLVGPNGAGKSTIYEFVVADRRPGIPFVNADLIADVRWPSDPLAHGHDAATVAAQIRDELIARHEPFVAETVASHPSKVDLVHRALDAGYHVNLIVVAVPGDQSVARVRTRVQHGGHDVPEDRVRARYRRLWDNVVAMIEVASTSMVFDNSGPGPITVATFVSGDPIGAPRWPAWLPSSLSDRWPPVDDAG